MAIDIREEPQAKTIDLNQGSSQLGEEALRYKAEKFDGAMGEKSPGQEVIFQQLSNTSEQMYRQMIADQHAMDDMESKTKKARELLKSREMSLDDLQKLYEGTAPEQLPPETVVEDLNARKHVEELGDKPRTTAEEDLNKAVSEHTSKQFVAQNMLKDFEDRYAKQGLGSRVVQRGAQFVPFASWFTTLAGTPVRPSGDKPFLQSDAIQAEIDYLYTLSPVDFYYRLREVTEGIYAINPADGLDFLSKVNSYDSMSQVLDTVGNVTDVGSIGAAAVSKARRVLSAGKLTDLPKSRVLEKAGNYIEAAQQRVIEQIERKPTNRDISNLFTQKKDGEIRFFRDTLDPIMNVDAIGAEVGTIPHSNLILDKLKQQSTVALRTVFDTAKITRGTQQADNYGIAAAEEALKREAAPYERAILGFNKVFPEESALNAGYAEVRLGKAEKPQRKFVRGDRSTPTEGEIPAAQYGGIIGTGLQHSEALDDLFTKIRQAKGPEAERKAREAIDKMADPYRVLGFTETKRGTQDALPFKSDQKTTRKVPPVPKGMVRVYHSGDAKPQPGEKRWFSSNERYGSDYRQGQNVWYMDLPEHHPMFNAEYPEQGIKAVFTFNAEIDASDAKLYKLGDSADAAEQAEVKLGNQDALPFKSEKQAHYYANEVYNLATAYEVREAPEGGFAIYVRKAIDETDPRYRELLIETRNKTPEAGTNGILRKIAGDKLKVSEEQQEARAMIDFANQRTEAGIRELFKPIEVLSKQQKKDLDKVLEYNKYMIGPDGKEGNWFANLGDYEKNFRVIIGRQPTEDEALAYFTVRQLRDTEYMMKSARQYAEQSRYGVDLYSIDYEIDGPEGVLMKPDAELKGKVVPELPKDGVEGGVYVLTKDGRSVYKEKNQIGAEVHARIKEMTEKEGYKIIQLANTNDAIVRKAFGFEEPAAFVVVHGPKRRPLPFDLLPYRSGTSKDYVHEWWTKQMKTYRTPSGRVVYDGDISIWNHETEAKSLKSTKALEQARVMLRNGDEGFDDFVLANLPISPEDLRLRFFGSEDGKIEPIFDIDTPFSSLRSGTKTVNVPDKSAFIDGSTIRGMHGDRFYNPQESPYNIMNMVDKSHVGERDPDVFAIKESWGTEGKPIFTLVPAQQLDPLKSLAKSMAKSVRSQHYDDYKIKAIDSWIAEFGDLLTKSDNTPYSQEQLFFDPVRTIQNAKFNYRGKDTLSIQRIVAAHHAREAILNLLSIQTDAGRQMDAYFQKLASTVYTKLGPEWSKFVPTEEIRFLKDPTAFLRSIAFHFKMSFLNPVQAAVNFQTFLYMAALGDARSFTKMFPAVIGSQWDDLNPVARRLIGKKLEKVGWSPGAFEDAQQKLLDYGADIVGRSHAYRDDVVDDKFVRHTAGKVLDVSSWFFTKSEQFLKKGAWFLAYDEQLRKTGKSWKEFTKRDYDAILNRAQTLNVNMTRNASAGWQRGTLTGLGTQFTNYQMRTMELFWGKSAVTGVTPAQKAKLFLGMTLAYGGFGGAAAMTGLPLYDIWRQGQIAAGKDPNDPTYEWFYDGGLNLLLQATTGYDFNTTQRYGPNGLPQLQTLMTADELGDALADILLGAAGQIVLKDIGGIDVGKMEIHGGIGGLLKDFSHLTNLEEDDGSQPSELLLQDFSNVLRNISTVNSGFRIYAAANMQSYVTKNGIRIDDTPLGLAIMQAFTGLDPQAISDIFTVRNALKSHARDVKAAEVEVRRNMDFYMQHMNEGRFQSAKMYLNLARSYAIAYGLNNFEMNAMIRKYMKQRPQDLIDIMQKQWGDPKSAPRGIEQNVREQSEKIFEQGNQ